ncbi:MAG: hypothetical protein ACKOEX_10285 [Planctomycetia bacterium]
MSTVTMRTQGGATRSGDDRSGRGLAWWALALLGFGLLAFLLAWLLGWFRFTTDPRILEIRQMQKDARDKFVETGGPTTMAEATEAVVAMSQIREKIEALPEPLRQSVERGGGSMFRSAMRARIDAYFAAPPEKRIAELDRQIRQEEMMRKAFEAAGAVRGFFGGQAGGTAAGQGSSNQAASGGQRSGPPPQSDEARQAWRKRIIDTTTPEQRARYSEYRRAMDVRRTQLGLPPSGPPGGPR